MLLTSADIYVIRSYSVLFHIPLAVYSCGLKCNTFPLFTLPMTQNICFSRKW